MSRSSADTLKTACITVLGSGFMPFASGTWGSLTATALFGVGWCAISFAAGPRWAVDAMLAGGVLLASLLAVAWGRWAMDRFESTDPKPFVLDEFAGQWIALLAMPMAFSSDWWALACIVGGQFFLFRLTDVIKPPPARQLEFLPAGWGVLCDDLAAGAYANLLGQIAWRLTPLSGLLGVTLA